MTNKTHTEIVAAQAQTWRERVATLTASIATAGRALAEADAERAALSLSAAAGDAKAVTRLGELRRLKAETEASIDDLRLALGEAERQSTDAERVHARAVRADIHARARGLADRRIAAARAFDDAAEAMTAAYAEWEGLGRELISLDLDAYRQNGISMLEAVTGTARVQAAFPKIALRVFPAASAVFAGGGSLAVTETAQWSSLPTA